MNKIKSSIEKLGYQGAIHDIIKQRDDNAEKRDHLIKQLKDIDKVNENFYLDIDSVFEELKVNDPNAYEAIKVKSRNSHEIKFVSGDTIYTVEQNLGYKLESVVGCRISIKKEQLVKF